MKVIKKPAETQCTKRYHLPCVPCGAVVEAKCFELDEGDGPSGEFFIMKCCCCGAVNYFLKADIGQYEV